MRFILTILDWMFLLGQFLCDAIFPDSPPPSLADFTLIFMHNWHTICSYQSCIDDVIYSMNLIYLWTHQKALDMLYNVHISAYMDTTCAIAPNVYLVRYQYLGKFSVAENIWHVSGVTLVYSLFWTSWDF